MNVAQRLGRIIAVGVLIGGCVWAARAVLSVHAGQGSESASEPAQVRVGSVTANQVIVHQPIKYDVSAPLVSLQARGASNVAVDCGAPSCGTAPPDPDENEDQERQNSEAPAPPPEISAAGAAVEQTSQGGKPAIPLLDSFDGLGEGFQGPQGTTTFRNPSDNSLAVGPDDVVQIVNSRFAVYTKKGKKYDTTGKVLYGPVPTNDIFTGFGGVCEARDSGDAVVRYDQLAGRWLVVMPMFSRVLPGEFTQTALPATAAQPGQLAHTGQTSAPGPAAAPPANPKMPPPRTPRPRPTGPRPTGPRTAPPPPPPGTSYAMCYAVSTSSDPLGTYYRYAFERTLFPDYPRPAIWTDGYYVPTSTGDTVIQKHDCIADRTKMLQGLPATEQCIIIDGVNFLNNSDIDGQKLPPAGAPNIMLAGDGTQLKKIFDGNGIYAWKVHVDWNNPANTKATGPVKIPVAPYHYLCNGQLTSCVPQPGTERRLDAQGDKIMQRVVYRRIGHQQSIVAAHSVATKAGGGGVRWYEFRIDKKGDLSLYQQGTYAPDQFYRWMPSIDMDKKGDIGFGYSFGGTPNFPGQRFVARKPKDPKGTMGFHETVLANGEASQTNTLRWEDYTTTAMDPSDDCTFWYVGDYLKKGNEDYSTKIGAFRVPGCGGR